MSLCEGCMNIEPIFQWLAAAWTSFSQHPNSATGETGAYKHIT